MIGRGRNGWHANNDTSSLSGAYAEEDGDRLARDAIDGALVYDAENADEQAFVTLVMRGPMCKTSLAPDAISPFTGGDRKAALEMIPFLGGGFRTYALAAQDETFSGLDQVGVGVYEGLLRKVPGVRIGRVVGGEIAWDEGEGR